MGIYEIRIKCFLRIQQVCLVYKGTSLINKYPRVFSYLIRPPWLFPHASITFSHVLIAHIHFGIYMFDILRYGIRKIVGLDHKNLIYIVFYLHFWVIISMAQIFGVDINTFALSKLPFLKLRCVHLKFFYRLNKCLIFSSCR